MRKLIKDGRFEMRIEKRKLKLLEAIAERLGSDRSSISNELISLFVDNYDQLSEIAKEKKVPVIQLVKFILVEYISRTDKNLILKISI